MNPILHKFIKHQRNEKWTLFKIAFAPKVFDNYIFNIQHCFALTAIPYCKIT